MQFKRGDEVKFLGGNFPIGIKEGTDEFLGKVLSPLPKTFVWDALESGDDKLYVIQHNDGADLETFKHYASYFGKIDFDFLKPAMKYLLVHEQALVMLNASKRPAPQPKPAPAAEPTDQEEVISTDGMTEEEIIQTAPLVEEYEEAPVEPQTHAESQQATVGVHAPHFTVLTCPQDRMMNAVSKPMMVKTMKMGEPFTIDGINGIEEGRAGDYLMRTEQDFLLIYPKEAFDLNYEFADELIPLPILGKTYNIMPEVAEYIDKLQVTNASSEVPEPNDVSLEASEASQEQIETDMLLADELEKNLDKDGVALRNVCQKLINKHPQITEIVFKKTRAEEEGGEITEKFRLELRVGTGSAFIEIG